MQNNGRMFCRNWQLPVLSMSLKIIFACEGATEEWVATYNKKMVQWIINGQPVSVSDSIELKFQEMSYFLALAVPSDAYAYEIEKISEMLDGHTETEFKEICKQIKRSSWESKKASRYYHRVLLSSSCFIKMRSLDMLGRKHVFWKLNRHALSSFKRSKLSVQNIRIQMAGQKETVSLFYTIER